MKHDELEKRMREYESSNDERIRPNMFVVARIDGRNFHRLTRNLLKLPPYDNTFCNIMWVTLTHVMKCGIPSTFGYTQSDEMSILLNTQFIKDGNVFSKKIRKFNSIFAGEASAFFTQKMNEIMNNKFLATFDCRIIQLPTINEVYNYFHWRRSDSERNCLSMLCYHSMINKDKLTPFKATKIMEKNGYEWRMEKLFNNGINFNEIEQWKKTGKCVNWIWVENNCLNKKTNKEVVVNKKVLNLMDCPKDINEYEKLIDRSIINDRREDEYNNGSRTMDFSSMTKTGYVISSYTDWSNHQ